MPRILGNDRERGVSGNTRRIRFDSSSMGPVLANRGYPAGTSSSVVASRDGSAKPRTHFSDAGVSYFRA
jgi:hypothetical protein